MNKMIKTYEENGIRYQFDSKKLNMYIGKMKHSSKKVCEKTTKEDIKNALAEKLYVSPEAVKNWMYGYNGPSELEQVKLLGDFFAVDYHEFLKAEEEKMTNTTTIIEGLSNNAQAQYTKEIIRKMYSAMLDYFDALSEEYFELKHLLKEKKYDEYREKALEAHEAQLERFEELLELKRRSLLDLPEKTEKEIDGFLWEEWGIDLYTDKETESIMMLTDEEMVELFDGGTEEDERDYENYLRTGYLDSLKKLFADYMVK